MKLYTILRNQRTHPFSCFAVRSANSTGGSERRSGQNSLYKFPLVPTVNRHSAGTPAKSQISGHVLAFAPQRYHVVPLVSSDAPTSAIIIGRTLSLAQILANPRDSRQLRNKEPSFVVLAGPPSSARRRHRRIRSCRPLLPMLSPLSPLTSKNCKDAFIYLHKPVDLTSFFRAAPLVRPIILVLPF